MGRKPNPLTAEMKFRLHEGTMDGVRRAAADERITAAELVRKAVDDHLAKGTDGGLAERVVAEVEAQVADAVTRITARSDKVAGALELIAQRLDGIEAAQGRRAA
jgi:hypothetical protein